MTRTNVLTFKLPVRIREKKRLLSSSSVLSSSLCIMKVEQTTLVQASLMDAGVNINVSDVPKDKKLTFNVGYNY